MSFTGIFIPPVSQQKRAVGTLDIAWVLEVRVRQVRERLSERGVACHGSSKTVLLSVTSVKEVVGEGQDDKQSQIVWKRPFVLRWVVVGKVQGAVAVSVRHTGDVPKDQHEAEFLVRHVPGWNNQLLALGAGVGVKPVGVHNEQGLRGDVAVVVVLLESSGKGKEVQGEPWDSDLEEHFQVQVLADSRVQWSTHEAVVDVVSGHSVVILGHKEAVEIQANGENKAVTDGSDHDLAKMVNDVVQLVSCEVQANHQSIRDVKSVNSVTVVRQLLVFQVSQRLALGPNTRQSQVEESLHDKEGSEESPGGERRHAMSQKQVQEVLAKILPALARARPGGFSTVEFSTDPHIDHQKREACHHAKSTNWTTKVPLNGFGCKIAMRHRSGLFARIFFRHV